MSLCGHRRHHCLDAVSGDSLSGVHFPRMRCYALEPKAPNKQSKKDKTGTDDVTITVDACGPLLGCTAYDMHGYIERQWGLPTGALSSSSSTTERKFETDVCSVAFELLGKSLTDEAAASFFERHEASRMRRQWELRSVRGRSRTATSTTHVLNTGPAPHAFALLAWPDALLVALDVGLRLPRLEGAERHQPSPSRSIELYLASLVDSISVLAKHDYRSIAGVCHGDHVRDRDLQGWALYAVETARVFDSTRETLARQEAAAALVAERTAGLLPDAHRAMLIRDAAAYVTRLEHTVPRASLESMRRAALAELKAENDIQYSHFVTPAVDWQHLSTSDTGLHFNANGGVGSRIAQGRRLVATHIGRIATRRLLENQLPTQFWEAVEWARKVALGGTDASSPSSSSSSSSVPHSHLQAAERIVAMLDALPWGTRPPTEATEAAEATDRSSTFRFPNPPPIDAPRALFGHDDCAKGTTLTFMNGRAYRDLGTGDRTTAVGGGALVPCEGVVGAVLDGNPGVVTVVCDAACDAACDATTTVARLVNPTRSIRGCSDGSNPRVFSSVADAPPKRTRVLCTATAVHRNPLLYTTELKTKTGETLPSFTGRVVDVDPRVGGDVVLDVVLEHDGAVVGAAAAAMAAVPPPITLVNPPTGVFATVHCDAYARAQRQSVVVYDGIGACGDDGVASPSSKKAKRMKSVAVDASATGTFEGTVEWVDPVVGGAVVLRRVVSMPKDGYKHMKADAMLVEGRGGRKPTLMTSTQCLDRIVDEHRLALHT